jgi:tetratricopeptide (TPR) repeat protein
MVGEYEKALDEVEHTIDMGYEVFGKLMLGATYSFMGKENEAIEIHEQLVTDYGMPKYDNLGMAYIRSGRIDEGKKILKELETKYDTIPSPWGALKRAQLYAALGDYENAVKWYKFEPHHHFVPWVRVGDHMYDSTFQNYPGFKELMRRFDLPDPAPIQYDPALNM